VWIVALLKYYYDSLMKIVIQSTGEVMGTPQLYEVRTSRQLTLIPKSVTTEARSLLINVRLLAYSSIKKQARLCEMTMLYVCTASLPLFTLVVTD